MERWELHWRNNRNREEDLSGGEFFWLKLFRLFPCIRPTSWYCPPAVPTSDSYFHPCQSSIRLWFWRLENYMIISGFVLSMHLFCQEVPEEHVSLLLEYMYCGSIYVEQGYCHTSSLSPFHWWIFFQEILILTPYLVENYWDFFFLTGNISPI